MEKPVKLKKDGTPAKQDGRPTIFTEELALTICKRIASGESLRKICEDDKMPDRTIIYDWLLDPKKKTFTDQYETACNTRADNMFDELVNIADTTSGEVQRDRLRVDTRKWYLSKVLPKKYGEKLDVTSLGEKLTLSFDPTFKNAITPSSKDNS